jgi:hypothetical protein
MENEVPINISVRNRTIQQQTVKTPKAPRESHEMQDLKMFLNGMTVSIAFSLKL